MKSHTRSDGLIGDYCDAELFKSIPLFQGNEHSLQIILFFDEMEVTNPLGSQAGVYKLGNYLYSQVISQYKCIMIIHVYFPFSAFLLYTWEHSTTIKIIS